MKALVIGGNNFFGIDIVNELIKKGFEVHIMNRGNKSPKYLDQVTTHICDRENRHEFERVAKNNFDLVFDQFCMNEGHALQSVRVFQGKCGKYVMCSSQSVYGEGGNLKEADFSAENYTFSDELMKDNPYAENKKRAESILLNSTFSNLLIVRPSIVMGENDPTGRLDWHIQSLMKEKAIHYFSKDVSISFVFAQDLANKIVGLGLGKFTGPFNICSGEAISIGALLSLIEDLVGRKHIRAKDRTKDNASPYSNSEDWCMNIDKLVGAVGATTDIMDWLPTLVKSRVESLSA